MVALRGVNGVMLSSLRPISNGIVADTTSDALRGKIFGQVQSALVMGMLFTSVLATPIARMDILGIQGWRVAFVLVGSLSVLVCMLLVFFFVDPAASTVKQQRRGFRAVLDELRSLVHFFTIPTFSIMIMQGIFGSIPWGVLGMMTLFFQLAGLSDGEATLLQTEGLVVGIFGNLLGGIVADALARRFGYHGRPLNAQFTVAVGLPLITAMFYWITPGEGNVYIYFVLLLLWALLGCWAQSGTNFPILSDIVPADKRCRILAWECCLENTVASAVTPFIVATVSTYFGYSFSQEDKDDPVAKLESAKALGKSMTLITIVPGICCFCVYSILHCTYERDVKRMQLLTNDAKTAGCDVTDGTCQADKSSYI
jgi:MFS family permease